MLAPVVDQRSRSPRPPSTRRRRPSSPSRRAPNRRIVRHGPSIASGGITACSREPSGSRASTMGEERSRRRRERREDPLDDPEDPGVVELERHRPRARPARSTKQRPGPLTMISSTVGSSSSGSSAPSPTTSSHDRVRRAARGGRPRAAGPRSRPAPPMRARSRPAAAPHEMLGALGREQPAVHRGTRTRDLVDRTVRASRGHPRRRTSPSSRRIWPAAAASGSGSRVGKHAGVDGARDRGAERDSGDDRTAEDLGDVGRAERAARLLEHDEAVGARGHRQVRAPGAARDSTRARRRTLRR